MRIWELRTNPVFKTFFCEKRKSYFIFKKKNGEIFSIYFFIGKYSKSGIARFFGITRGYEIVKSEVFLKNIYSLER